MTCSAGGVQARSPNETHELYFPVRFSLFGSMSGHLWVGHPVGLGGRPIDLISQTEGLVRVVHYLDASRAAV